MYLVPSFADQKRSDRFAANRDALGLELITIRCAGRSMETWEDFVGKFSEIMPGVELLPLDHATLLYTSGSTAFPKGVLSTHRHSRAIPPLVRVTAMDDEGKVLPPNAAVNSAFGESCALAATGTTRRQQRRPL